MSIPCLLSCGRHTLELGRRTLIMGIVNITPDSFSDGGHFFSPHQAVKHALELVAAGADILDVGGESTRPFSDPVSVDQELERVIPVISALSKTVDVPISIDTVKAAVAREAVMAGAGIINDIAAFRMDPDMAATAAQCKVPVILMHMQGTPKTMQKAPIYTDLIGEIKKFLQDAMDTAMAAGVDQSAMILDPGIGFGKTVSHNLQVLNALDQFLDLGAPLLVGTSRKHFVRQVLKDASQSDLSPLSPKVTWGTQATVAAAALKGAHIVRVHDVARTRATVRVIDAIRTACPA
ncbi:dihydropteroate synthase [Desulfosarcina sp. OttesenSCG-928-A07]|nr:dihydropteroate synthase [Desulfosarcina sp. OttesenSCG-928-G17]MDL2330050.1 dihydropteroate synthase [Desulfosarcina sp. OttesenSCG-928-A07]